MLYTTVKSFNQLTKQNLYQILRLRSEVFVVEQNCVYQDIDDYDQKALHLFVSDKGEIIAYARLFNAGDYHKEAGIGRVLVSKNYRKNKLGNLIIEKSIEAIELHFNTSEIAISAQTYLKKFYEFHNFRQKGVGYLEDGIPHIKMYLIAGREPKRV